jgi:hypothetical protein
MKSVGRFQDNGLHLWRLSDRYLVQCPRCRGRAAVRCIEADGDQIGHIVCRQCGFEQRQELQAKIWYGPVQANVRQRCRHCGRWLEKSWKRRCLPRRQEVRLLCPGCEHETLVPITWEPVRPTEPIDYVFGFPLWLQTPCCGETLWAYNEEHLRFLKDYVTASIRERQPNLNGSLASRLPQWIKRAHNRDEISRCIERLERALT